jgi:hypothetical protein
MRLTVTLTGRSEQNPEEIIGTTNYELICGNNILQAIQLLIQTAVHTNMCTMVNMNNAGPEPPQLEDNEDAEESGEQEEQEEQLAEPEEQQVEQVEPSSHYNSMIIGGVRVYMFPERLNIPEVPGEVDNDLVVKAKTNYIKFMTALIHNYKKYCLYDVSEISEISEMSEMSETYRDISNIKKMQVAVGTVSNNTTFIVMRDNRDTMIAIAIKDFDNVNSWNVSVPNEGIKYNVEHVFKSLAKTYLSTSAYNDLKIKKKNDTIKTIVNELENINKKLKIIKNMGDFNPDAPKIKELEQKYKSWGSCD